MEPPPHCSAIPEALIACLLQDGGNARYQECLNAGITDEALDNPICQMLFRTIGEIIENGDVCDELVLTSYLEKSGKLEQVGGIEGIYRIQSRIQTPACFNFLVKDVRDAFIARTIIRKNRLINERLVNGENPDEVILEHREFLKDIELPEDLSKPLFIDLRKILAGEFKPELPDVGSILDGSFLFYSARLNEVHGAPSDGKTNIGLGVGAQVLNDGGTVLFLDPEDTAAAVVRRLISFGAKKEAIEKRFKYVQDPTPKEILEAIKWAEKNKPDLVWMDGLAEFLSALGLSENEPSDILQFFRRYAQPFAKTGAAVVISDHVVKSTESRGSWSRGSGAKMGRYDGVSYEIRMGEAYSPSQAGYVKLVVSKDRNGGVGPKGTIAAEAHFRPLGQNVTEVSFQKPTPKADFRPTALMDKILNALTENPDSTKRDLRKLGSSKYVDEAIKLLIDDDRLACLHGGPGKPSKFTIKPTNTNE